MYSCYSRLIVPPFEIFQFCYNLLAIIITQEDTNASICNKYFILFLISNVVSSFYFFYI